MNEFYDVQLIGSTQHIYKHTHSLVLSFRDVLYYIISLLNLLNLYLPYIHKMSIDYIDLTTSSNANRQNEAIFDYFFILSHSSIRTFSPCSIMYFFTSKTV